MFTKLFVITGASGCGKTTLLNSLIANKDLNIIKAPKYSNRIKRDDNDDIIYAPIITKDTYDLVYKLNEKTYGIKLNELKSLMEKGKNLIIILSDVRVLTRLKRELKEIVVSLYISSAIDHDLIAKIQRDRYGKDFKISKDDSDKLYIQYLKLKSAAELEDWGRLFECMGELTDDWNKYIPEKNSTEIRKNKIRDFHKTYIDNISLFDHVILNHNYENPLEMTRQAINLLNFYKNTSTKLPKKNPIIFIVSAASGSGKGLLMESIKEVIGSEQIKIITKEAKREKKENDRRDGMIAIGEKGSFSPDYNLTWFFHRGEYHGGTEYAVSEKVIRENLAEKIPQIFISNIGQIDRFKKLFGSHAVFLYLHATRSDAEIKDFQYKRCKTKEEAEQRIKEIEKVHQDFISTISEFDHVLLNTAFPEDLYEQMFRLIDYYNTY